MLTMSLTASKSSKTFLKSLDSNIKEYVYFWYCIMKCVNIWKMYITQSANIFQMTNV